MESTETGPEPDDTVLDEDAHKQVQPEDFENDPSRNPDDPEWEALKGG